MLSVYLFMWEHIFYFFMNFFESKAKDLTKIAWGILTPWPTRWEDTPHLYGVWPECVPVFSVKVKNRDEEVCWDVCGAGKGRAQGKSSPVTQVSSQRSALTFHACGPCRLLLPISSSFSGTLKSLGKLIFRIWLIDSECILPS